ncbi:hypothetical protein C0995_008219 [Termitomyces sp. Mi166|nr:hypothetical protein C0995_008219 [Termitomyces sp. Mi166\
MPPRFINPHFLPESSVTISRSDIYAENEDIDDQKNDDINPLLVNHLKELIFAVWDFSSDLRQEGRSKKRRKLSSSESTQEGGGIVTLPYLVATKNSSASHFSKLLFRTREPETEDSEVQATIRAERAKATAVDGSCILLESHKSTLRYGDLKKLKLIRTTSPMPSLPAMMVVESTSLQSRANFTLKTEGGEFKLSNHRTCANIFEDVNVVKKETKEKPA